jgi:hypothetical protein
MQDLTPARPVATTPVCARRKEKARRSGGSVATGLLLVLTADCKARNAPRFASPSAFEANESKVAFQ